MQICRLKYDVPNPKLQIVATCKQVHSYPAPKRFLKKELELIHTTNELTRVTDEQLASMYHLELKDDSYVNCKLNLKC